MRPLSLAQHQEVMSGDAPIPSTPINSVNSQGNGLAVPNLAVVSGLGDSPGTGIGWMMHIPQSANAPSLYSQSNGQVGCEVSRLSFLSAFCSPQALVAGVLSFPFSFFSCFIAVELPSDPLIGVDAFFLIPIDRVHLRSADHHGRSTSSQRTISAPSAGPRDGA